MGIDDFFGELDLRALIIGLAGSLIFIVAMWKLPAWQNSTAFDFKSRLLMSLLLPIICYFIVKWQINK